MMDFTIRIKCRHCALCSKSINWYKLVIVIVQKNYWYLLKCLLIITFFVLLNIVERIWCFCHTIASSKINACYQHQLKPSCNVIRKCVFNISLNIPKAQTPFCWTTIHYWHCARILNWIDVDVCLSYLRMLALSRVFKKSNFKIWILFIFTESPLW